MGRPACWLRLERLFFALGFQIELHKLFGGCRVISHCAGAGRRAFVFPQLPWDQLTPARPHFIADNPPPRGARPKIVCIPVVHGESAVTLFGTVIRAVISDTQLVGLLVLHARQQIRFRLLSYGLPGRCSSVMHVAQCFLLNHPHSTDCPRDFRLKSRTKVTDSQQSDSWTMLLGFFTIILLFYFLL